VANQGVFDSQAGPEGIGTDSARDGENAARRSPLLNLATEKGSGESRSLSFARIHGSNWRNLPRTKRPNLQAVANNSG